MAAAQRVVILGAGFGGLSTAHTIKRLAPSADLLVLDRSPAFQMGLRKLWVLAGTARPGEGLRRRDALSAVGVPFRQSTVQGIDLEKKAVVTSEGDVPWDYLVVALGAEARPDLIPGGGLGSNPNLYAMEGAAEAGSRLTAIRTGHIAVVIAGLPYKCPPAAYEAAFLMDDVLRRTGRRARVTLEVVTPQPTSIPAAGAAACTAVEGRMDQRNIDFRTSVKIERLEPGRAILSGATVQADLMLIVPPHRPPQPVTSSGLAGQGGWIPVDPKTLKTQHDRVFAIGDAIDMKTGAGLPFPKAGVFAEAHGEVVGRNIAAMIAGREPDAAFDGEGYCFMEVGGGEATMVKGNFLSAPPNVAVADPSAEGLAAKHSFEAERLGRWFGK